MASDLVSLGDAAALLGVSSERVRQLVVAGDLPGVRFGNAWAVPRESINARRQVSNLRGRPLSARRAWEVVADGNVDLSNVSRFRNRGEGHRYQISAADLAFVAGHERALVSGVAAAVGFGELLEAEVVNVDLYVSSSLHEDLRSFVAAVPDQLARVIFRVVPDEIWPYVRSLAVDSGEGRQRLAPRAAVALDLMESGDSRQWVAAEHLIEIRG